MVRRFGRTAGFGLGILLAGCYALRPVQGAVPTVGTKVAFDVNDAGRVALGGSMGPEISQIEGQLIEKNADSYLVAVSTIRLLRGGEQVWSGEQVRLKPEYLGPAYERRVSTGRSIGLGVSVVGGFALVIASKSLLGSGTKDDPKIIDTASTRLGRP